MTPIRNLQPDLFPKNTFHLQRGAEPVFPVAAMGSEAQEAVLASFRKFDADSSGAISREELGAVLKAPDFLGWDLDGPRGQGPSFHKSIMRVEIDIRIFGFSRSGLR